MTEQQERRAVITEALTWRGTPFVWEAAIKGVGVDCGRFIAAALNGAGVRQIDIAKLPHLSPQWFLHHSDESFIKLIEQFATEYEPQAGRTPKPASMVVAKLGMDWGHSALVMDWPKVIGAANEHCVTVWNNVFLSPQYGRKKLRYFDFWGSHV
jgi:hypothetical protein